MKSILVAATVLALGMLTFAEKKADAAVAWTMNAAACSIQGANSITAGAVTAGAGSTVTLYCPVDITSLIAVNPDDLVLTYKGASSGTSFFSKVEFCSMPNTTGVETCVAGTASSSTVVNTLVLPMGQTFVNLSFYYVRITLKSGTIAGQLNTAYGAVLER